MFRLSLSTFRDRWPLFIGAVLSVAVGVALVESSLRILAAAATPPIPPGLSPLEAAQLRDTYDGATTLMGMTAMLSTFLAIFIVSSTFAFTVAQRRRDLALLRLLGGGRGQLRGLLLSEAVLLGLCGVAAGIPLATPAAAAQTAMLTGFGFLPGDFTSASAGWTVLTAAGTGIAVALLGVLTASRRASRIRPLEALRDSGTAAAVMTASRWVFGLLLLACSVVLVLLSQSAGLLIALALSMSLTMTGGIALSLLSPLVVPLTGRVFGLVLRGSTLGGLAEANLRAGVRRSAATAAPLIVLVALVLGLSGTLSSLARASGEELTRTVTADLVVESTGAEAQRVAAVPGVAVASPEITAPMTLTMPVIDRDTDEPEEESVHSGIVAVDPAAYARTHHPGLLGGSLADLRGPAIAATERSEQRLTLGSTFPARVEGTDLALRLVAILPERISTSDDFLVPRELLPAAVLAGAPAQTLVRVADGTAPAVVADRIRAAKLGTVSTVAEWAAARSTRQQDTNVRTMIVLMALSGLYALMAVINAVVIAGTERKRDFAVTRVIGLSRPQVIGMALIESLAVTVIGLFLGGLVVAGTLAGVAAGTARAIGVAVVDFPWTLLGLVVLVAFAAIGTTSVLTTLAATRPRPISLVAARE
jgi:putative ABC transport system permease protein